MRLPNAVAEHSRRRFFPHGLTFWAFLSQVLWAESPCRETVRKVQAWYALRRQPRPGSGTAAYCRARSRLSHDTLLDIHRHTADELQRRVSREQLWCGRHVKIVDGTGVSMPDTARNQRAFPQPSNQKKGCGFPVAKLVGCFCLASGALLHWAEATLRVHESKLFRKLFAFFLPGDILSPTAACVPMSTSPSCCGLGLTPSCACIRPAPVTYAKANGWVRMTAWSTETRTTPPRLHRHGLAPHAQHPHPAIGLCLDLRARFPNLVQRRGYYPHRSYRHPAKNWPNSICAAGPSSYSFATLRSRS